MIQRPHHEQKNVTVRLALENPNLIRASVRPG